MEICGQGSVLDSTRISGFLACCLVDCCQLYSKQSMETATSIPQCTMTLYSAVQCDTQLNGLCLNYQKDERKVEKIQQVAASRHLIRLPDQPQYIYEQYIYIYYCACEAAESREHSRNSKTIRNSKNDNTKRY